MRHTLSILFLLFAAGFLFAQQSNGIRIGNGSSGKAFFPEVTMVSETQVEITSAGEKITGVEIFDNLGNMIGSAEISATENTSVNINGLQQGLYYVAVISESGQEEINTFIKQ